MWICIRRNEKAPNSSHESVITCTGRSFVVCFYLQNRLKPRIRQRIIKKIARKPFVIKSMIVMPIAIQNRINPIILFIEITSDIKYYSLCICGLEII